MGSMPQNTHTHLFAHQLPHTQSRIPSHLLPSNGARVQEPAPTEGLDGSMLELTILRFDDLMSQLNGGKLSSSQSATRKGAADAEGQGTDNRGRPAEEKCEETCTDESQGRTPTRSGTTRLPS